MEISCPILSMFILVVLLVVLLIYLHWWKTVSYYFTWNWQFTFPSSLFPSIDLTYIEDKNSGLSTQALLNHALTTRNKSSSTQAHNMNDTSKVCFFFFVIKQTGLKFTKLQFLLWKFHFSFFSFIVLGKCATSFLHTIHSCFWILVCIYYIFIKNITWSGLHIKSYAEQLVGPTWSNYDQSTFPFVSWHSTSSDYC